MAAVLYPSNEWCEAWKNALNNSDQVKEVSGAWGEGWNGSWVFEITPGSGLEDTAYVYIATANGGREATDCRMLSAPSDVDHGFLCTGSYEEFKYVVKGEKDFIEGVVKGVFKVKGDMSKIMRNAKWIRAIANSISTFEASYLGE